MAHECGSSDCFTVTANAASHCPPLAGSGAFYQDTPPDVFTRDNGRRQVSWLAGRRLLPPSRNRTQWLLAKGYPLTVAGAAAALDRVVRTAFPFDSEIGNRRGNV